MSDSQPATANRAVFLSYASQDAEAVERIAVALRAAGIEVWFDKDELVGGDAWDAKIRGQIASCALFVPVISAATQARHEGYFRLEWKLAAQRTHMISERVAFLLPVVIDGTRDTEADVPGEFRAVQWTRLIKNGEMSDAALSAFGARVRQVLGGVEVARVSRPVGSEVTGQATRATNKRSPVMMVGSSLAVLVVIATTVWLAKKSERPAVAPVAAATANVGEARTPPPAPTTSAAPRRGPKSIVVLPFENLSADKEANAVFVDGMHLDVISNLLLIRELPCVPRDTAMTFRGTKKPHREIAEELGVAYVLTGTVSRVDQKVRITGTLINPRTDEAIWNKPYEKNLTDIFAIQAELAQAIAGELKAVLSPEEKKLVERRATEDPVAYDFFLKARDERYRATGGGRITLDRQTRLLESAVARDREFAGAWAELARAHALVYMNDIDHSEGRLHRARTAIETAVRFAPSAPEVILNLGYYYYFCFRDYERASRAFRDVVKIQPNSALGYFGMGNIERRQGKWTTAVENFRKVGELDPAFVDGAAQAYETAKAGRRYAEAREAQTRVALIRRTLESPENPDAPTSHDLAKAWLQFFETGSLAEVEELLLRIKSFPHLEALGRTIRIQMASYQGDAAEVVRLDKESLAKANGDIIRVAVALSITGARSAATGRLEVAAAKLREVLVDQSENSSAWSQLGRIEALLGHSEEALRCALQGVALLPVARDTWYGPGAEEALAFVFAWTGDKPRAIETYARLLAKPGARQSDDSVFVNVMKRGIWFAPLQGDPRFEALLNDPKNNAPLF